MKTDSHTFAVAEQLLAETVRTDIKIKTTSINGNSIRYIEAGSGHPILLIHGVNTGWGQWHLNIAHLSKHFKVYALDLPGAGGSTKIDYSEIDLEGTFVDVVQKFLELLQLERVSIVGHSLGGWIALKICLRKRINIANLVLVDSIGFTDYMPWKNRIIAFRPVAKLLAKTVMKPSIKNLKSFLEGAMKDSSNLKPEFVDYYFKAVNRQLVTHPFMLMNRLSGFTKMKSELLLVDELEKIDVPTLLILGDDDPLIPITKVEKAFNLIPNSLVHIMSAGHTPFIENHDNFNKVVTEFIQKNNGK